MKAIVVTPTYNEAENVEELVRMIRTEVSAPLDILVVDSASPDGTADRVRELQKSDSSLHLLEQKAKLGLGNAYRDGIEWVLQRNYDCLITMDADLSHQPKYLRDHLREIEAHDLVVGSRYVPGGGLYQWPRARLAISRFANWYAATLTGLPFQDLTSGFHCFRTALLQKIVRCRLHTEGYAFLIELKFLAVMQGARTKEIPIIFAGRERGYSKISKRVILESMGFVLKLAFLRGRVLKSLANDTAACPGFLDTPKGA